MGWDDTVTIGTLSIQKLTDTYRYGQHAVSIQMMVTDPQKRTTFPDLKLFVSHLTFIQLSKILKHIELILIVLN